MSRVACFFFPRTKEQTQTKFAENEQMLLTPDHRNDGLPPPQNMKGCLHQTHVQPSTRAMKWQQPSLWHKRAYLPSATAKLARHVFEGEAFPDETLPWQVGPKMTWFRQTSERPPTSTANTTRRARLRGPTNSG